MQGILAYIDQVVALADWRNLSERTFGSIPGYGPVHMLGVTSPYHSLRFVLTAMSRVESR